MISFLCFLFGLWNIAGIVTYLEKACFSYKVYNAKQKLFLALICGPIIWVIALAVYLGIHINKKIDEILEKL